MKRKLISGGFLFVLGFVLGTITYSLGLISFYLSLLFVLLISFENFKRNINNSPNKIIDSYKKDNIFENEVLKYTALEIILIFGFLIPIYLAPTDTQIISCGYIFVYVFFTINKYISIKTILK